MDLTKFMSKRLKEDDTVTLNAKAYRATVRKQINVVCDNYNLKKDLESLEDFKIVNEEDLNDFLLNMRTDGDVLINRELLRDQMVSKKTLELEIEKLEKELKNLKDKNAFMKMRLDGEKKTSSYKNYKIEGSLDITI